LGFLQAFRITASHIATVIGFFAPPAFALSDLTAAIFLVGFHFYALCRPSPTSIAENL
jgi:hypothetical protein